MTFWSSLLRRFRPSLPELFADSEEGFVDTALRIHRHSIGRDGSHTFHVRASSGGSLAGFAVDLLPVWRPDTLGEGIPVFWGEVRYRSIGPESTAFIRALAAAYGAPTDSPMAPAISFAAIALKGNPGDPSAGPVAMKLFFESADDDRYAEVYTNLDLALRTAEFREKDNEYRAPLLRALITGAA